MLGYKETHVDKSKQNLWVSLSENLNDFLLSSVQSMPVSCANLCKHTDLAVHTSTS